MMRYKDLVYSIIFESLMALAFLVIAMSVY